MGNKQLARQSLPVHECPGPDTCETPRLASRGTAFGVRECLLGIAGCGLRMRSPYRPTNVDGSGRTRSDSVGAPHVACESNDASPRPPSSNRGYPDPASYALYPHMN